MSQAVNWMMTCMALEVETSMQYVFIIYYITVHHGVNVDDATDGRIKWRRTSTSRSRSEFCHVNSAKF